MTGPQTASQPSCGPQTHLNYRARVEPRPTGQQWVRRRRLLWAKSAIFPALQNGCMARAVCSALLGRPHVFARASHPGLGILAEDTELSFRCIHLTAGRMAAPEHDHLPHFILEGLCGGGAIFRRISCLTSCQPVSGQVSGRCQLAHRAPAVVPYSILLASCRPVCRPPALLPMFCTRGCVPMH
jgi:hypothetical protein